MLAGQAVMINWSDVAVEDRPAYYAWHNREHMVGTVSLAGFERGRRYIAARAKRDFLMLYEIDSLAVLIGREYMAKVNNPSPLTQRTTKFIQNAVRGLTQVKFSLGLGLGGHALTLRFDPQDGSEDELGRYLTHEALPRIAERPDIVGAHFCVTDQPASAVVTVERRGRPTVVPNWIVILEGISLEAVESACDGQLSDDTLHQHGCIGTVERGTYSLQLVVPKSALRADTGTHAG